MNPNHFYCFIALFLHSFHSIESIQAAKRNEVLTQCVKPGTMALTFDDGPSVDENVLSNYLKGRHVKGSFFVNGNNYNCIYDEEMVSKLRQTFAQGHLIGSHSWSHPDISTLTPSQLVRQLELTERALMKILGVKPKFFRPPYGEYNQQNLDVLHKRGYTVVNWSFDSEDSLGAPAEKSKKGYAKLAKQYPAPQIALNHETIPTTPSKVIPYAVPLLQNAGYRLVHVSECLGTGSRLQDLYQWVGKPSERDETWTCEGTPAPGVA